MGIFGNTTFWDRMKGHLIAGFKGEGMMAGHRRAKAYAAEREAREHQHMVFLSEDEQRARGHRGGWLEPVHGYIDGREVTASFGWGTREGETLLADGHVPASSFMKSDNHNHYGKGSGPNRNVKDRFRYSGPGS